jgi:hypothetical protein
MIDKTLQEAVEKVLTQAAYESPSGSDVAPETTGFEVMLGEMWIHVEPSVWRSWTDRRRLWGQDYHGMVYNLGTDLPYTGRRACNCLKCQESVEPALRPN